MSFCITVSKQAELKKTVIVLSSINYNIIHKLHFPWFSFAVMMALIFACSIEALSVCVL